MDFLCQMFSRLSTSSPASMNYHGLSNQGATCYLNSVLQVLFMTRDFREAVQRSMSEDPEHIDCQLKDLFNVLHRDRADTYNITKRLGIDRVFEQRDAAEYLEKILALTSDEASQNFHGELTHHTKCSTCDTEKSSDGKFWHLPLELVKSNSETYRVVDGIEEYFKELSFSGENQMYCDQCGDKSDATTKCELKDPPEVLTLLLKRFEFDDYYMMYFKNNCAVDVPCSLHIPKRHVYELYAVVHHCGDLRSGHYTATVKSQDDEKWYKFDDIRVTLLDPGPFQQNDTERSFSAYLLFYRKKQTHAADTCADEAMEVSTNGSLPDARVTNTQSQDAETGREREEDKTEDTAEVDPVDRHGATEPRDMISDECREPELAPKHIGPVEHQDNTTEATQRGQHSDQGRNQDAHTKKLELTGADHSTRARRDSPMYNYFLKGFQSSGSAGDHNHSMPEDDGGCKQGGSDMLCEGPEQQRRDVKGDNKQSDADDDGPAQRKETFTPHTHNVSERRLHDVTESRPEQRMSVSYPTHTEQATEQENKGDEHIQNRDDSERRHTLTERDSVGETSVGNPQSQESAELKEVVVEGAGRQIHARVIDEEIKDTPHGRQRHIETTAIFIVTTETSTKVSIRSQADVGGSTDSSQLDDSPRPEQQTHRDTPVFDNAKEEDETNCTSHSSV